jgi:RNA polymerase sigma factor (sigma-70 family)
MNSENISTDEELACDARNGCESSFKELVDRHSLAVYRVGYGITGNRQEAEDIAQETFFKAFKNIDSFSPEKASFKTWLLAIARNQSINVFSSLKRKTVRFLSSDEYEIQDYGPADNSFQPKNDPETQLINSQEHKELQEALKKLPERQRTAIMLKTYEDLSYEEIAGVMNTSASSVESLIFRARRKLLEIMGK